MTETETAPQSRAGRRSARQKPRGWKLFLRDLVVIIVAAILISFFIKTFLIRSFYIPSQSMENTLMVNDRIIVNLLSPGVMPLSRGDIVVFKDPGGWLDPAVEKPTNPVSNGLDGVLAFIGLSAQDNNDHLIKRVIGLPGDHVVCCNAFGQLSVNGVPIQEPYISLPSGVRKASPNNFDVTVPANSLWVMGDNRYESADSAYHHTTDPGHEYVPYSDVVGRAILISWPVSRWGWLDDYPVVFHDVGNPAN